MPIRPARQSAARVSPIARWPVPRRLQRSSQWWSKIDGVARLAEQLGTRCEIDAFRLRVLHDRRSGTDERLGRHDDRIPERRIDAEEAVWPDRHVARNHDMGGHETMVADDRVMADMVAAPQGDVVADPDERLNGVVLKDEAVLADRRI